MHLTMCYHFLPLIFDYLFKYIRNFDMINQYDYHYKVYIDKCLALVSTMIIKSTKDARDMSNELFYRTLHRYDENDPSSWIYYKHISGEYHVTDEPIYVISVDTTERIIFNKENLKIHKKYS